MKLLLISLMLVAVYSSTTHAQSTSCGVVNATNFYNRQQYAQLNEFPWLGVVYYKDSATGKRATECAAHLISNRYLLTSAICLRKSNQADDYRIMLGSWKSWNIDNGIFSNCDDTKKCAPLPLLFHVEAIIKHPDYDGGKKDDIALIRLKDSVKFTKFIRPVCLPDAAETLNNDFVTQHLTYIGWQRSYEGAKYAKSKLYAQVLNTKVCNEKFPNYKLNEAHICVYCDRFEKFAIGAALMGVTVKDSLPDHYYLLGLINDWSTQCDNNKPNVLLRIDRYVEWIQNNMT